MREGGGGGGGEAVHRTVGPMTREGGAQTELRDHDKGSKYAAPKGRRARDALEMSGGEG